MSYANFCRWMGRNHHNEYKFCIKIGLPATDVVNLPCSRIIFT